MKKRNLALKMLERKHLNIFATSLVLRYHVQVEIINEGIKLESKAIDISRSEIPTIIVERCGVKELG